MTRLLTVLAVVVAALGVLILHAAPAEAHGSTTPGVVSVAQTFGPHELTVLLYPPVAGEGAMPVRIVAQGDPPPPMVASAVPTDGPRAGGVTSETALVPAAPGRTAAGTLQIDRPGPWEIVLSLGGDTARIPLSVAAPVTAPWVWAVRGGLTAAVVLLLAAAVAARRRSRWAAAFGAAALAGLAVVVTASVLAASVPAAPTPEAGSVSPPAPGPDTGMEGMDMSGAPGGEPASAMSGHGTGAVVLTTTVTRPGPGAPVDLGLALSDGSTGAPVDDLAVHDDALVHLAVLGPQQQLRHVHPLRTGPGRFTVRLALPTPGAYGVFAETERADGGHQVARSAFALDGAPEAVAPDPLVGAAGGAGPRRIAGTDVDVALAPAVAGQLTRVQLTLSRDGAPVRDLQAWLGMAGHLMVLGPGRGADPVATDPSASFAHVHDMAVPGPSGALGPVVAFRYAFPAPGRYQLWAQYQRNWQLVTVPITLDVAPAPTVASP